MKAHCDAWVPQFAPLFLARRRRAHTSSDLSGRFHNFWRDNETKRKIIGREHPMNHELLQPYFFATDYMLLLSGERPDTFHGLGLGELVRRVRDSDYT